jgi:hypothetical protein
MRIEDTLEGVRRLAPIAGTAPFDLEFRQLHQVPASTCPFDTLPKALQDFMGGPVGTSQTPVDGTHEHGNLISTSAHDLKATQMFSGGRKRGSLNGKVDKGNQ